MYFECANHKSHHNILKYLYWRNFHVKRSQMAWPFLVFIGIVMPRLITDGEDIKSDNGHSIGITFIELMLIFFILAAVVFISNQIIHWLTYYSVDETNIERHIRFLPCFNKKVVALKELKFVWSSKKDAFYMIRYGNWPWQNFIYHFRKCETEDNSNLIEILKRYIPSLEIHELRD